MAITPDEALVLTSEHKRVYDGIERRIDEELYNRTVTPDSEVSIRLYPCPTKVFNALVRTYSIKGWTITIPETKIAEDTYPVYLFKRKSQD